MDFVSNTKVQREEMLRSMGINSLDSLFSSIPSSLIHPPPSSDDGISELEALEFMESLSAKNTFSTFDSYLGGGAYAHYIPAIVSTITSRSEFLTSYTPYQPESSQGYLQAIFEFQSVIAALTGLDVANASVYDGASACAEAVLMALRIHKDRKAVILSKGLHPTYRGIIEQYLSGLDVEILENFETGHQIACVLAQSPNFFGVIEEMNVLAKKAHENDSLFIACGNPIAYGLFSPPGEYGADIAVGDCQPLGLGLNFGGPYVGYMACKEKWVRQLPGRIVGETIDNQGKRGYLLALQAREQHIRREKATSNICTNQTLGALACLITTLWWGPVGLKRLALMNYKKAHYLSQALEKLSGFSVLHPHFNEFTLTLPSPVESALSLFRNHHIEPGIPLSHNQLLVAVTELKSLEQLDKYIQVASKL